MATKPGIFQHLSRILRQVGSKIFFGRILSVEEKVAAEEPEQPSAEIEGPAELEEPVAEEEVAAEEPEQPSAEIEEPAELEESVAAEEPEQPSAEIEEPAELEEPVAEEEVAAEEPEQPSAEIEGPAELEEPVAAEEPEQPSAGIEEPAELDEPKPNGHEPPPPTTGRAPRYRPPVPNPQGRRSNLADQTAIRRRNQPFLDIVVRIKFDRRTDSCSLSLLLEKDEGIEEPITVSSSSSEGMFDLIGLDENWYQDVQPQDIGTILGHGTRWTGSVSEGRPLQWQLTGRQIYVLGISDELSGFVSKPRLELGKQHVVICSTEILPDVLQTIKATASPEPSILEASAGMPNGWVALKGVRPSVGIEQEQSDGILGVLYPFPDVDITFEGGIKIGQSTWLACYPPTVRLTGPYDEVEDIRIDTTSVDPAVDGVVISPRWDEIGKHLVFCGGKTSSYSIESAIESWEPWDGQSIQTEGGDRNSIHSINVCGTLVSSTADSGIFMTFTDENPILLGKMPGEIYECSRSPDIPGVPYVGFPTFLPVWSFPKNIESGNKDTMRVVLLHDCPPATTHILKRRFGRRLSDPMFRWSRIIRQAYQRGLSTEGDSLDLDGLWRQYKMSAKRLWKLFS